jgi:transposase-like protein
VAIVETCPYSVEEYLSSGRQIRLPRPNCPACGSPMSFWSGYWRWVRTAGRCARMWVPRARCTPCRVSHGVLPDFCLLRRLDVATAVGAVLVAVLDGGLGVRTAAGQAGVPHTTAREWVRRFAARSAVITDGFALPAEADGTPDPPPAGEPGRVALAAVRRAWQAATRRDGPGPTLWPFAARISAGALLAATTSSPWRTGPDRRVMPRAPSTPSGWRG